MSFGLLILVGLIVVYELAIVTVVTAYGRANETRLQDARRPVPSGSFRRSTGLLRASDAQREEATEVIGAAMADGRVDIAEGIRRIERALCAQHCAELQALVADLGEGQSGVDGDGRRDGWIGTSWAVTTATARSGTDWSRT